jgi:hypothetical protein|tara:strand:- start:4030 stop:4185 length:156 start_codon:yes stop_codon:yes gene_type:complete
MSNEPEYEEDEQLVSVAEGEVKIYKTTQKKSESGCICQPPVRNRLCELHGG